MKRFIAVQAVFLLFSAALILHVAKGLEQRMQKGDNAVLAEMGKTAAEIKQSINSAGAGNAAGLDEIKKLGKEIADRLTAAAVSGGRLPADTLADETQTGISGGNISQTAVTEESYKTRVSENDYRIQMLMEEGSGFYRDKEYGRAAAAFKKILGYDAENRRALVYYCSSVFKLNPGDEVENWKSKKILEPLTDEGQLEWRDRYTAIEVLQGISVEEGDNAAAQKYAGLLEKMEAES